MKKRLGALFLTVVILLGMVPAGAILPVRAADIEENVTVEGTNGFGTLLSSEIIAYQAENSLYESGYAVIDLVVDGRTATVTYSTLEDAVLLVGLYSEDGMQLLCSGTATVSADETEATVTIQGNIPRYFMASAYLLDVYDRSPLCAAFETPMYTRPMQELLASTVADYDPEKVLNLDESTTTNFAVYADSTRIIEYSEGVNLVTLADHDNGQYVINNADSQIMTLAVGDVFAYSYGENEILIVKVGAISIDGTTVSITGAQMEMEEVFAAVKIESEDSTENLQVTPDSMGEGVTYEGLVDDQDPNALVPADTEGSASFSKSLAFSVGTDPDEPVSVKGSVKLGLEISFNYYISASSQYVDFKIDKTLSGEFEITGKKEKEWSLCKAVVYPVPGVSVGFQPVLKVGISGQMKFSFTITQTLGFSFDNVNGFLPLSLKPQFDPDFSMTGTISVAVDLQPQVEVAEGWIAEFKLELPIGVEVEISQREQGDDMGGSNSGIQHACNFCLDAEISFTVSFGAEVKFLKCKWLTFSSTIASSKTVLGHIYFSLDLGKIGWGACPNVAYRVTFDVRNENDESIEGADVWIGEKFPMEPTNAGGVTICYLPAGVYEVLATVDTQTIRRHIQVEQVCLVTMKMGVDYPDTAETPEPVDPEELIDRGTILLCGDFGAEGDNAHWDLYTSGLLEITGTGVIEDGDIPWEDHTDRIKKVIIGDGITSLPESAFYDCTSLAYLTLGKGLTTIPKYIFSGCSALGKVSIPDSVTEISYHAFYGCSALAEVTFGSGVTAIKGGAFNGCTSLTAAELPDSVSLIDNAAFSGCTALRTVTMGKNLTTIGAEAFSNCVNLKNLTLGVNLTTIGTDAFAYCTSLVSVRIPDTVTVMENGVFYKCTALASVTLSSSLGAINRYTFQGCTALRSITIPDSVTKISFNAFYGCTALGSLHIGSSVSAINGSAFENCTSLTSVTIPDSVTLIDSSAFSGCESLVTVTMGSGVTTVDLQAFLGCKRLTNLTIGENVTTIGNNAFEKCVSLTAVTIPESVTTLGSGAFYNCSALESVSLSSNLSTIASYTFQGCTALQSITIPDSVTSIGYNAFCGCSAMASLTIGGGVTEIDGCAFENCLLLKEVTIPASVTVIDFQAFSGCKSLETVTMGSGLITVGREAFYDCESLTNVLLGSSVTTLGDSAFQYCKNLTSIYLPDSVVSVDSWAFYGCSKLSSIRLSENLTAISHGTFYNCEKLTSITIPASVGAVQYSAFSGCTALTDVYFYGDAPTFSSAVFDGVTATCHYPAGNSTWTEDIFQNYEGTITWTPNSGGGGTPFRVVSPVAPAIREDLTQPTITPNAVYGGEYGAEEVDGIYYKTASFTGLVPGEQYVLLAVVDPEAEDLLAAENLLFVRQAVAAGDGTLTCRYLQRVPTEPSYVMLCGASHQDLADATITFPAMYPDTQLRAVRPRVVYDGVTLVEGLDYIVVGTVDYTNPGTYECMIRGIRNYSGQVVCSYTVQESPVILTGKSFTLSFEDEILVNFYYTAENTEDVVELGMLVFHEDPVVADFAAADAVYEAEYVASSGRYFASTEGIAAKEMGDDRYYCAYARHTDGTCVYSTLYRYSPKQYAMSRIQNSSDENLKALCVAMLNYGAAAQEYFGYRPDALMNAELTDEQKALVIPYDASLFTGAVAADPDKTGVFTAASGFGRKTATVSFEGALAINFYFAPNAVMDSDLIFYYWTADAYAAAEKLTAANASGKLVIQPEDGVCWASVEGIAPKALDETYYVAGVYLSDAGVCSTGVIAYSLSRYCMNNASGSMGNLAQTTAMYGYYAKQYFTT